MQSDRRSGKRDKRQRSSFKFVDGKSQTMPSDKEVSEVGHVKWKDCPKGDVGKLIFPLVLNSPHAIVMFHHPN